MDKAIGGDEQSIPRATMVLESMLIFDAIA
jgi:hypothetical protein